MDTPHAKAKGSEFITTWPAGNKEISAVSYAKTQEQITSVLEKT